MSTTKRPCCRHSRVWSAAVLGLAILGGGGLVADESAIWDQPDLEERIAAVNDGQLRFVPASRARGAHAHRNEIRITEGSLADGWVNLEQCHQDLDPVPAAQIVFHPQRIRGLRVLSAESIGLARIEGHSVQLRDVSPGARLCLRGESRALHDLGGGHYRLRNGPFMRRFLDGYYPMRVFLDIAYPSDRIRLAAHSPDSQEGFRVSEGPGRIGLEANFEGRLVTCFDFCTSEALDCAATVSPCRQD